MVRSRYLAIASAFAAVLSSSLEAHAQRSDAETAAEAHDARAAELFDDGQYSRALVELQAAQEILPATPRVYNIAACHVQLGDLTQAIVYYQRFIEAPDAPDDRRQAANDRITELRNQLEAEQGAANQETSEGHEEPHQESAPEASSRQRLSPTVFYALLGVTAAAGVGLAVTGGIALYWQGQFKDTVALSTEGNYDRDSGQPWATAGDVLIGVTAAGALAALVVGLLTRWRTGDETSTRPTLTIGGTSFTLSGAF